MTEFGIAMVERTNYHVTMVVQMEANLRVGTKIAFQCQGNEISISLENPYFDFFFSDIAMVLRIVPTDQTKLRNAAAIKADNSLAKGAENVFRELAFATEYRIVRINPTNQIAVTSGTIL